MLRWTVLFLVAGLPACATQAPMAPVTPDQVTIHESVVSAPVRYQVIKRLWVESWLSAFTVPSYRTQEEGMEAFRQHAVSLGGNGVINFGCYRKPGIFSSARLACNGTIVRFL
jgi:uncharacterized protein YbjQ (UPF0145 family)